MVLNNRRIRQQLQAPLNRLRSGLSLMTALTLVGVTGLTLEAIAPQVSYAAEDRLTMVLARERNETFASMVERAERAISQVAQRRFDSDPAIDQVMITVLGENRSLVAPILSISVSRQDWRASRSVEYLATYYPTSEALLQLEDTPPAATPVATPASGGQPAATQSPPAGSQPAATQAPSATGTQPAPMQTVPSGSSPSADPTQAPIGITPDRTDPSDTSPSETDPAGANPDDTQPATDATESETDNAPSTQPDVNLPAAPSGQLGLPRSILE